MNSFKIFKKNNIIAGFTNKKSGDFSSKALKKLTTEKLLRRIFKKPSKVDKCHPPRLKGEIKTFYFMEQVHGTKVKNTSEVLSSKPGLKISDKPGLWEKGSDPFGNCIKGIDGLITNQKGILLLIKTADCLPVLIFDSQKQVIAAVHSGWRGTVGKIVIKAILKMISQFNCQPKDLLIAIGPCAHRCCFKHDQKDFVKHLAEWRKFYKKKGNFYYIDLVGKLKHDLIDAGIKPKNIDIVPICTICDKNFFSHQKYKQGKEEKGLFLTYIGFPQNPS